MMDLYKNPAFSSEERAKDMLKRMTLKEKLAQMNIIRGVEYSVAGAVRGTCSVDADDTIDVDRLRRDLAERGIGYVHDIYSVPAIKNVVQRYLVEETRLGIPAIFTAEALHGCSMNGTSIFPVPLTLSQTFDPELVYQVGDKIAAESRAVGHTEILAPNLDVARDPRWGRMEETFGEDTYLSCEMAAAIISGEQKGDISRTDAVIAEPKHYCVHGMPEGGLNCAPARVGQREVETCYLPVFEAGIKRGGAYNVMSCYNCIDGELVITSEHYQKEVLKERYGMRGITRADWGAVMRIMNLHHMAATKKEAVRMAVAGGLDMQGCCDLPFDEWEAILYELVNEGALREEDIDDSVFRILKMKFELGLFEHPYTDEQAYQEVIRCDAHKAVMYKAAQKAMTLLKNDGILPLKERYSRIALIGPSSANQKVGGYSSIPEGYVIRSVYDELRERYPEAEITQCNGCAITHSDGDSIIYVEGQPHLTKTVDPEIEDKLEAAVEAASRAEIAVIVCGDNTITSGESMDRANITLFGRQRELILRVAGTGVPVVLVLENGKALDLSKESEVCNAILVAGFAGEFGAKAIVEALAGDINPAGRLSVSYPKQDGMIPCYYSRLPGGANGYLEGDTQALYAFGHGLSYTDFTYDALSIEHIDGYRYQVTFQVTNTGDCDGDEVVQLYINDMESSVVTPLKLLRKFQRAEIAAGMTRKFQFELGFDDFKLLGLDWKWKVEPGRFDIMVGASSEDIRLHQIIYVS